MKIMDQKRYLRFTVNGLVDPIAVAIPESHSDLTIEEIIDRLAAQREKNNQSGEAESIREFKNELLVLNGQAININMRAGDIPFTVTPTSAGEILFAEIQITRPHVMGVI